MTSRRVVVVGDLLQDILAELQEPLAPGDDARAAIHTGSGGSAANVAVRMARLGVETSLACRVGDDPPGRELAEEITRSGVTLHATQDASLPTGRVIVLVAPDGERTMITDRGAGRRLAPEDVPQSLFRSGRHLHLSGYSFFEPEPQKAALVALRRAREGGMTVSVDPSSAAILSSLGPERFLEWTEGSDLCFPNLDEGAALTGEREPERIVQSLSERYPEVILKLGPDGAMYGGSGRNLLRSLAQTVRATDTTGAGDAFCAGFLALWLAGGCPAEALEEGNRLAAEAIGAVGARSEPG